MKIKKCSSHYLIHYSPPTMETELQRGWQTCYRTYRDSLTTVTDNRLFSRPFWVYLGVNHTFPLNISILNICSKDHHK